MRKQRKVIGLVAVAAVMMISVLAVGYILKRQSMESFAGDGYILEIASDEAGQSVTAVQFAAGSTYEAKYPSQYKFRDVQNSVMTVDEKSYIHYADESLSAFSDGTVVNLKEASTGLVDFYHLQKGMVMTNAEEGYTIDNNGSDIVFEELLWQLAGDTMLVAGRDMKLVLSGAEEEEITGYLEIRYLESDIVQIAGRDRLWQAVASNSYVRFPGGAVLDLAQMAVTNEEGESLFTIRDLMADMGIALQSRSGQEWEPPVFNIQVENGRDGENGEEGAVGEDGEEGEGGELGDAGEAGTSGTAGAAGQEGSAGEEGARGGNGAAGSAGEAGAAGGAGETGADGGSGAAGTDGGSGASGTDGAKGGSGASGGGSGTGGSNPGSSEGVNAATLGTIRISQISYDCSKVDFTLSVSDDSSTFVANSGTVEIRETDTNRLIWSNESDSNYRGPVNFASGNTTFDFSCDFLSPDKAYTIVAGSRYSIETTGDIVNSGYKTFVKRDFFTSSEGFTLEPARVTTDTVRLAVSKQDYSNVNFFMARVYMGDMMRETELVSVADDLDAASGVPCYELLLQDLFADAGDGAEFDLSNREYRIEVYTSGAASESEALRAFDKDSETGEYIGLTDGSVQKSSHEVTGITLKAMPEFEKDAVKASRSNDGFYELSATPLSDRDNSIKNYHFTVRDPEGNICKELDSPTGKVNWYYGGILGVGTYTVEAVAVCFDNEKNDEIVLDPAYIVSSGLGAPTVSFEAYEIKDGHYVDSMGNIIDKDDGEGAVNASRIWGDLIIVKNGAEIDTSNKFTVVISANNEGNTYSREISVAASSSSTSDRVCIPVKLLGLEQECNYTFTVYGTVNARVTVGSSEVVIPSTECLGKAVVRTSKYAFAATDALDDSAFCFTVGPADSGIQDEIVMAYPYTGSRYSELNKSEKYARVRNAARAVEFTVYGNNMTEIGVIVKDMYDTFSLHPESYDAGGFEEVGSLQAAETSVLFYGPLRSAWSPEQRIVLTKQDFAAGGMDIDSLNGTITVAATALYDYSYGLWDNYEEYRDSYLGDPVYNRIPLNALPLDEAAGRSTWVNMADINLNLRPPALFTPADSAVTVTQIKNTRNNRVSYYDPKLSTDTTIAMLVQSNYPNYNGDTVSITYYGMTMDDFKAYSPPSGQDSAYDIVKAYREGVPEGRKVKFGIEIKCPQQAPGSVPGLYVVLTDREDLLEKCREEGTDAEGNPIITYKAAALPGGTQPVFYTDLFDRGDCYVFAVTLESMYNVKSEEGKTDPWIYPYDISRYVSGVGDYGGAVQRNPGEEVLKQAPQAAVYLDHTDENEAVWKYLVYDPDGAVEMASPASPKIYAGDRKNLLKMVQYEVKKETGLLPFLLQTAAEGYGSIKEADASAEIKQTVKSSFGLEEWDEGSLSSFTVKVTDGNNDQMDSYMDKYYEVWIRANQFNGVLTEGERNFVATRISVDGNLEQSTNFAVETAMHRYDYIDPERMKELPVTVSLLPNSEILEIRVGGAATDAQTRHLVALYYELYEVDSANPGGLLRQCETVPWQSGGSVQVAMANLNAGAKVKIKVQGVYDTGRGGLNLKTLESEIREPKKRQDTQPALVKNSYYGIQLQESVLYATQESASSGNLNLIYGSNTAAGSLYQVQEGDHSNTVSTGEYARTITVRRALTTSYWSVPLRYVYGAGGAVAGDYRPILKELKMTDLALSGTGGVHTQGDGTLTTEVPVTKPSATARGTVSTGIRSVDISVTLTGKSNAMLYGDKLYENKIYLELYTKEGENATKLPNTDNRFFALKNGEESDSSYAAIAADASGDAYFLAEEGPTDENKNYKFAVRNLGTENVTEYWLRMYCYQKNSDGSRGDKVYILDNSSSVNPQGLPMDYRFQTSRGLQMEGSSLASRPLTVTFGREGYERQRMTIDYAINNASYYSDFYLEYELRGNTGEAANTTYKMEEIMGWMNYTQTVQESYEYYDNGWKTAKFPVYTTAEGTRFTIGRDMKADIVFTGDLLDKLKPGGYTLTVRAIDKRTGSDVPYLDRTGTAKQTPPSVNFNVANAVNPLYGVNVISEPSGSGQQFRLTIFVQDPEYRLGWVNDSGTRKMGSCQVEIWKRTAGGTEENITSQVTVSPAPGEAYNKDTPYIMTFDTQEHTQYTVKIKGVNLNEPGDHSANTELYNSDSDNVMREKLYVDLFHSVQMNIRNLRYNPESKVLTSTVINGANLDTINFVRITLMKVEGDDIQPQGATLPCSYRTTGTKSEADFGLEELLDKMTLYDGDILSVSMSFYQDGTLLTSISDTFVYEAPREQ